jgi:hypothetical protein
MKEMPDKLESLIKAVYERWKVTHPKSEAHPDEETLACFLENRLSAKETSQIKDHLLSCESCAETVAVQLKLKLSDEKVPEELVERIKNLLVAKDKLPILEILLQLKERALEILHTTGDVLVGQELVPAPILRARKIKDFKDEVTILKAFPDILAEIKIENKQGQYVNFSVIVKEKETQKVMKDLRVTLIKDDVELESYLTDSGRVIFEHVLLGKYTVEISTLEKKFAAVLLDIKI